LVATYSYHWALGQGGGAGELVRDQSNPASREREDTWLTSSSKEDLRPGPFHKCCVWRGSITLVDTVIYPRPPALLQKAHQHMHGVLCMERVVQCISAWPSSRDHLTNTRIERKRSGTIPFTGRSVVPLSCFVSTYVSIHPSSILSDHSTMHAADDQIEWPHPSLLQIIRCECDLTYVICKERVE
jgi:hypothetical protein